MNAENAGFRAGDVYQALAAAEKPLAVAEIAKAAGISTEDTILGLGWLFRVCCSGLVFMVLML